MQTIRNFLSDFVFKLNNKYKKLEKKKKILMWLITTATICTTITVIIIYKNNALTYVADNVILDCVIKENGQKVSYVISTNNDGIQTLYKDNKLVKTVNINESQSICDFDFNAKTASDKITESEDNKTENAVGNKIYRGEKGSAQRYLAYLKEQGYNLSTYVMNANVWDGYLKDENENLYRFIYIKKTDETGVVIFSKTTKKAEEPSDINEIIKEYT